MNYERQPISVYCLFFSFCNCLTHNFQYYSGFHVLESFDPKIIQNIQPREPATHLHNPGTTEKQFITKMATVINPRGKVSAILI